MIPLSNGGYALCDAADMDVLSGFKWFHMIDGNTAYAARASPGGKIIKMHNQITGLSGVDHANGNGLDNRRHNLRPASNAQQQMNRGKFSRASSRYKGVTWLKNDRKWWARIKANGKRIDLGRFERESDAAMAYNHAAVSSFGRFARINNI